MPKKPSLKTVVDLLEQLEAINAQADDDGLLAQEIREVQPFSEGIPTLVKDTYRTPTLMVKARFQYGGTWVNAGVGHTWLSVPDMAAAWNDEAIQTRFRVRRTAWQNSVLEQFPWDRLSLFGINLDEYEETYLVWEQASSIEPKIYLYAGHEEKVFRDLQEFLEFLIH